MELHLCQQHVTDWPTNLHGLLSGFAQLQVAADSAGGGARDPCARILAAGGGAGRCGERVVPRHVRAWPASRWQSGSLTGQWQGATCWESDGSRWPWPCFRVQRLQSCCLCTLKHQRWAMHTHATPADADWLHCAVKVPAQAQGSGAGQPAWHSGRGAGRQRAGCAVPRQAEHRAVA